MAQITTQMTITVTFDSTKPETMEHPPITLLASREDMLKWECEEGGSFDILDIRKATQDDVVKGLVPQTDLHTKQNAPDNPFPQSVPMHNAKGMLWGPPLGEAATQTYKYTISSAAGTKDPHIVIR